MNWNEGSWDEDGNPMGLPSHDPESGKFKYVWYIVRLSYNNRKY